MVTSFQRRHICFIFPRLETKLEKTFLNHGESLKFFFNPGERFGKFWRLGLIGQIKLGNHVSTLS